MHLWDNEMKTFKEYIVEWSLSGLIKTVLSKIEAAISSLKFGKKISVQINTSSLQEATDVKSRLGYYAEYVTAYELAVILKDHDANLTTERSQPTHLHTLMLNKRKEISTLPPPPKVDVNVELKRMESAGKVLAAQIFNDIVMHGEDYNALQFDIQLTGDSGKGITKADLILTVGKMDKQVIVDRIVASLKAYKTSSINLSNSTFISLIKSIFYDSGSNLPTRSEEFIVQFAKDYGSKADMDKLYGHQNIIGSLLKKGISKEAARAEAKLTHGEVIEIISGIFTKHYPKHKKEINERMLHMMGFDGEDDFYAAIGEMGKQRVVSSRKSKELQDMISKFTKDFNIEIARNGTTNNMFVSFIAPNGELITKLNVTFADTGGKSPQGKTNAFMNFSAYLK